MVQSAMKRSEIARAINKMWPAQGAAALVRRVLTSPSALKVASEGVLEADERRGLQAHSARELKQRGWSKEDLVLIDEADFLINGTTRMFGHTIVDEAQDLSAMEFRMIYRRTRGRSITILGDLAQATSPSAQSRWQDVLVHMGRPEGAEILELSLGYRVPAPLLEFANRLLPEAAPDVTPARSVRESGTGPRIVRSTDGFLLQDALDETRELAGVWQTVGVICPEALIGALVTSMSATDIRFGTLAHGGLDEPVTLLPPVAAKGLEFDAVLVVEPAEISAEAQGARRLYVSLTRAVQQLTIVHEMELPRALRAEVVHSP
jgi:DNA helicase IV